MVWFLGNPYVRTQNKWGKAAEYQDITGNSNINLSTREIRIRKRKKGVEEPYGAERFVPRPEIYNVPWLR